MVPFYEIQRSDIKIIHNKRELNYPTHVHEHMEILYIFDLSQHINIDGIDYEINAGEAAIIFPNTIHTYYREVYRDTDEICLLFLPGYKMSRPNVQKILYKNVQLVCLS